MTTITIPGNVTLSNFWTDALNTDLPLSELWVRYPQSMMSAAATIYSMRKSLEGVVSDTQISPQLAAEILTYSTTHTYAETATMYPAQILQYGANLVSILEGELDHSPSQILRFKQMVMALRKGSSMTNLLDEYPDIVLNGAYDIIHLDKWLKQGSFPS